LLRSLPNGIKDTVENINGKWYLVQRVGKVIFDGSSDESWNFRATLGLYSRIGISLVGAKNIDATNTNMVSTHFKCKNDYSSDEQHSYVYNEQLYLFCVQTNANDLKTWLTSNPVTTLYELATPIYTPLSGLYLTSYPNITNVLTNCSTQPTLTVDFMSKLWNDSRIKDNKMASYDDIQSNLTGTQINIPNSKATIIEPIKLEGYSSQVTQSQGKNLLDSSKLEIGDIDGATGLNLVATTKIRTANKISVTPNSAVSISESGNVSKVYLIYYDTNGTYTGSSGAWINTPANNCIIPSTAYYARLVFSKSDNSVLTLADISNAQLEVGTTATTYEAFIAPMPSPDYPSTINSVGDSGSFDLTSCGKNLLPNNMPLSYTLGGVTYTKNNDGSITATGTRTGTSFITVLSSGINALTQSPIVFVLRKGHTYYSLGKEITFRLIDGNYRAISNAGYTPTADLYCGCAYYEINPGDPLPMTIYPMLTVDYPDSVYEPYKPNKVTLPYTLRSLPDGTKDTIEKVNGIWNYVQRTTKVIFDGSSDEAWYYNSIDLNLDSTKGLFYIHIPGIKTNSDIRCSHFKTSLIYKSQEQCIYKEPNNDVIYVMINKSSLTAADAFKTWLVSNNITVIYELANPVYTPLSLSDLNLMAYDSVTNIMASGANLTLNYKSMLYTNEKLITDKSASYENIQTGLSGAFTSLAVKEPTSIEITKVDGSSSQVTSVQGKNICPTSFSEWESGTYDGTTGVKIANAAYLRTIRLLQVTPSSIYYVNNFETDSSYSIIFTIRAYGADGTFKRALGAINSGATFTLNSDEYYIGVVLYSTEGTITYTAFQTDFTNGTIKPFICLNSETDKTYAAFTPNAPSPDYPRTITSIGDTSFDVKTTGKNLLPYPYSETTKTSNGVTFTDNGDGSITINGTASAQTDFYLTGSFSAYSTNLPTSGQAYLSGGTSISNVVFLRWISNPSLDMQISNGSAIIFSSQSKLLVRVLSGTVCNNLKIYPQIELGAVPTTYEPYKSNKSTISNALRSLPNGVKDTIELINGKWNYVQRVGSVVITGSGNWASLATTIETSMAYFFIDGSFDTTIATKCVMMSDKFQYFPNIHAGATTGGKEGISSGDTTSNKIRIFIRKTRLATQDVTGFKNWLAANNVTLYYEMATPIYTVISDVVVPTFQGFNNIFSSASLPANLTYNLKSKLWNDSYNKDVLINKLTAAIIRLGGTV
jgi:hypothetical protein